LPGGEGSCRTASTGLRSGWRWQEWRGYSTIILPGDPFVRTHLDSGAASITQGQIDLEQTQGWIPCTPKTVKCRAQASLIRIRIAIVAPGKARRPPPPRTTGSPCEGTDGNPRCGTAWGVGSPGRTPFPSSKQLSPNPLLSNRATHSRPENNPGKSCLSLPKTSGQPMGIHLWSNEIRRSAIIAHKQSVPLIFHRMEVPIVP